MVRVPRWSSAGATLRVVLHRIDGLLDVADIAALAAVPEETVEELLAPLVESGAITFGDATRPSSGSNPSVAPGPRRTTSSAELSPDGLARISDEEQHRITDMYARLATIDHYRLLGVTATADAKTIKRAYYAQAKLFHPDRFFRKDIGALRPKIDAVFAAMTTACETLTKAGPRAEYDAYLREVLKSRLARRNAEQLERAKDWAAAAEAWERVATQLPADAYVLHRYAAALLRSRKKLEAAVVVAARAAQIDPTRAEYRITLASLYLATGRDRSAIAELEAALEIEQDRLDVAAMLAAVSERVAQTPL